MTITDMQLQSTVMKIRELSWDIYHVRYGATGDSSSASQLDALGGVVRLSVGTTLDISGTLVTRYSKATLQNSR